MNHVFFNLPWFPHKLISFQGLFAVNFIRLINQLYLYRIVLSVHFCVCGGGGGGGVISCWLITWFGVWSARFVEFSRIKLEALFSYVTEAKL